MIRAITPITASILFTLAMGCQTPGEKQTEARKDAKEKVAEAGLDAKKDVQNAKEDLKDAQEKFGEKVGEAQKELAEEAVDATKDVAKADAEAKDQRLDERYARFESIKNENQPEFVARAEASIAKLDTDLKDATKRSSAATANPDLTKAVGDATTALAEARKDLAELEGKTGPALDDGRLGVGKAINDAQGNLTDAYKRMAQLNM